MQIIILLFWIHILEGMSFFNDKKMIIGLIFCKSIFTGDAFGIAYRHYYKLHQNKEHAEKPILKRLSGFLLRDKEQLESNKEFLFPSTSPIDFDPDEAHKSVDLIVNTNAERAYLTHFGVWEDMKKGAEQMHFGIQMHENIMRSVEDLITIENRPDEQVEEYAYLKIKKFITDQMISYNIDHNSKEIWDILETDVKLNAQGIVIAAKRNIKNIKYPKNN